MADRNLSLTVLDETLAVCRLAAEARPPDWAARGRFWSMTRTAGELSLVCEQSLIPGDCDQSIRIEPGWRAFEVAGPLDFGLTGILASLAQPLARAGISIFSLSTFETDYLLVKETDLGRAVEVLRRAGHQVAT